jgi:hypothetical protein
VHTASLAQVRNRRTEGAIISEVEGKVAIVTGEVGGIGRAVAARAWNSCADSSQRFRAAKSSEIACEAMTARGTPPGMMVRFAISLTSSSVAPWLSA